MATAEAKPRSSYFCPAELEILMTAYAEHKHVFQRKSNTAAAVKQRELAWVKIAERVNACKPAGVKRTWQQLKMKYKNLVQTDNRRRAKARRTGGGPPPPPPALTRAEESALCGRPVADDISGGSSSDSATPPDPRAYIRLTDGVICVMEPSSITDLHAVEDVEDTLSAATKTEDTERPVETNAGDYHEEEDPSTSTAQLASLPVKQLYKTYLLTQIGKTNVETDHVRLQIQKTKLEIELLHHQLQEIKKNS